MNKNIPITNRQVKYATCVYDFERDGVTDFTNTAPKETSALSNQCTIVSVMVEFLIAPVTVGGAGLTYITSTGTTGFPNMGFFNPNSYSAGDILNFPVDETYLPRTRSGYLSQVTVGGTLTAGRFAITIGYIDNVYPTTEPE